MRTPFSRALSWAVALGSAATASAGVVPKSPMSREAQNALVNDYCSGCHSEKTRKGDLVLEGFDAASPFLGADFLEKMILKLRAGMMPPSGSQRPEAGALPAFVEALETRADASAARAADPGWRPLQRLNRAEYVRAVRDLLAVDIDAAAFLPADTVSGGFDNIADVQTVSPTLITAYLRGAAQISRLAMAKGSASRRGLLSCIPETASGDTACAGAILKRLTNGAYRGAATDEDRATALSFYRRGREQGGFEEGVRLAVQHILTSPKFLFRVDSPSGATAGGVQTLSGTALANRLSFFLWSSAPDGALLEAARRGALSTREGLVTQVRRMLGDPKADALSTRFATQWLHLQDLGKTMPDAARFPKFDERLARDMRRETETFVQSVFRSETSVLELLTADRSFLNERLAKHYGIPGVKGGEFRSVTMPRGRGGLLGQGSILVLTSLGDRTSPVLRGKWVLDVLLGTPPPPPPPNVPALDDSVKAVRDGKALSTRQRVEEHRRNPACASCHRTIDPPGLALEGFDPTGALREKDNGVFLDTTSELYDGTPISGPEGLREALLAHRDQILRNLAAQLLTYATGRRIGPRDMPVVRSIVRAAGDENNRFSAFILGIVASDPFRMAKPPKES